VRLPCLMTMRGRLDRPERPRLLRAFADALVIGGSASQPLPLLYTAAERRDRVDEAGIKSFRHPFARLDGGHGHAAAQGL
jgi:hypothetical protein